MDPTSLAFLNAGSNVLGKALSPAPAAGGGPSRVDASTWLNLGFDNSGWTVATSSATATATPSAGNALPYLLAAAAALLLWNR